MARPFGKRDLVKRSLQFPRDVDTLWTLVSEKMGVNKTAVLVVALRELAKREGISLPEGEEEVNG